MKELSIEEKAKAYDEAIERANELLYVSDKDSLQRKTVEHIFPELAESEDDKIKKELLGQLRKLLEMYDTLQTEKEYSKVQSWIAWLEKQGKKDEEILVLKDQIESLRAAREALKEVHKIELEKQGEHARFREAIQVGDQVTKNEDGVLVNLSQLKRVAKKDEKQGEQNTNHKTMFVKFICKKDWHGIGDYCCGKTYNGYPCEKEQNGYDIYDDNHVPTFCDKDFIDEYFSIITEEKQGEQNHAWSEEDKRILTTLINYLEEHGGGIDGYECIFLADWFKSLRPQSQWKPSEE